MSKANRGDAAPSGTLPDLPWPSLAAAGLVTPLSFVAAAIIFSYVVDAGKVTADRIGLARTLAGEIGRLDEMLTMSARMSAQSGDPQWESRYRENIPALDRALTGVMAIVPPGDARQFKDTTGAANDRLVAIEAANFDAVRHGRLDQARRLLSGTDYAGAKRLYATGLSELVAASGVDLRTRQQQTLTLEKRALAAMMLAGVVIGALWLHLGLVLRRWHRRLAATLMQRDKLLNALGASEARYRLLADNASDIMLTIDPDGTIRFASPSIRELGHFDPDALIGRNALALVHVDDRDIVRDAHLKALAAPDRTFTVEYRALKANGGSTWLESNMRAVRGADGSIIATVSVIRDLGVRKERESALERAALTDPLTGLLNRTAFRQRMDAAIARTSQPATLAMLDLDYFKRVNDSFGHATGDTALLALADLLRENLRPEDSIGRIGGEEFAILFAGLPLTAAATICDRLRALLATCPILISGGGTTSITMSLGLSAVSPAKTVDAIFAEADAALYMAKANGRNRTEIAGF